MWFIWIKHNAYSNEEIFLHYYCQNSKVWDSKFLEIIEYMFLRYPQRVNLARKPAQVQNQSNIHYVTKKTLKMYKIIIQISIQKNSWYIYSWVILPRKKHIASVKRLLTCVLFRKTSRSWIQCAFWSRDSFQFA